MKGQLEGAPKEAGKVAPKFYITLIERGTMTLKGLIEEGLSVPAERGKEETRLRFQTLGEPFRMRPKHGWWGVKVRSAFGGVTTLLYTPENGEVSGLLRLKR